MSFSEVVCTNIQSRLHGLGETFTDPRLCAAIVDRLTFSGTIIETGTDSYPLAAALAKQAVH